MKTSAPLVAIDGGADLQIDTDQCPVFIETTTLIEVLCKDVGLLWYQ